MSRVVIRAGLTIALLLALYSSAHAWTDKTPALPQVPGGYVQCRVTATGDKPIGVVAAIVSNNGRNVTEFGTGSRVRTENGFEAEETAGSFDSASSRYHCKFTVTGARRRNARGSLTAFDAGGTPVATVDAR